MTWSPPAPTRGMLRSARMATATKPRGFTLIELLVVLVIITLVVGFATLQLGSGGRENEIGWQVRHFADTLSLAVDEARFSSRDRGVALWRRDVESPWQYRWFERVEGQWQRLQGEMDSTFEDGQLSDRFSVELLIEDEAVLLPEAVVVPEEEIALPQIYFFSGGEATPFELTLWMRENDTHYYRIRADLLGRVALLDQDGEDES